MKRILIVEDEPDLLKTLTFRLQKCGYEILAASDGSQGLKMAAQQPNIILMDLKMPEMDGIELFNALQENEATKGIPVLFVTASRDPESIIDVLKYVGEDRILTKPYDFKSLLSKIEDFIL